MKDQDFGIGFTKSGLLWSKNYRPCHKFQPKSYFLVTIGNFLLKITFQKLKEHKFANTESVKELCAETYRELKSRTQITLRSMRLYLANKDTEQILFKPIRISVQGVISQLQLILWENYSHEERAIINAPTPEQVSLLLQLAN